MNDNKGKAHTLEHLIFTGSEKYPERGLLDKLATSCLSNGTNVRQYGSHATVSNSTSLYYRLTLLMITLITWLLVLLVEDC